MCLGKPDPVGMEEGMFAEKDRRILEVRMGPLMVHYR